MFLLGLVAFAEVAQAKDSAPSQRISVKQAIFLSEDMTGGVPKWQPASRIPARPGTSCYRWVLRVEPRDEDVSVKEVFTLPSAASHWGVAPDASTDVAPDRSKASTELKESLRDGILTNAWCYAKGDPVGRHTIEVYDGNRLLYRFEFEVFDEPV